VRRRDGRVDADGAAPDVRRSFRPRGRGQLGDGTRTNRFTFADVVGLSAATSLTVDGDAVCATVVGGSVECWGSNTTGELGTGHPGDGLLPAPVLGAALQEVAIGTSLDLSAHACARSSEGRVVCWGADRFGQLGTLRQQGAMAPADVVGLTDAMSAAARTRSRARHAPPARCRVGGTCRASPPS
jgi:hypothetical protein